MPDISRLVIEVDSKGVVTAAGNLENFARVSSQTEKSVSGFSRKMAKEGDLAKNFGAFQLVVDRLPGPMKSVASGLMGMVSPATAAVSAVLEIGDALIELGKAGLNAYAGFETIKTNLGTVMGSAEKAAATFRELQTLASESTFGVEQLAQVSTMLTQTGVNAKELIPTLKMLGDVSMGSAEKFNSVAYNYTQVAGTGKATAMDIRQFQLAGVPIAKMLADIGREGDHSFEAISEAIRNATEEGGMFFEAMSKGAETMAGKENAHEEAVKNYLATAMEVSGLADLWKSFVEWQTESLNKTTRGLQLYGERDTRIRIIRDADIRSLEEYNMALEEQNGLEEIIRRESQHTAEMGGIAEDNQEIVLLTEKLNALTEAIEKYEEAIEKTDAQDSFSKMIEDSMGEYKKLQAEIEDEFARTDEGRREALEEEIRLWEERLNATHLEGSTVDFGVDGTYTLGRETGITDKERSEIEAILRGLNEDLAKLIEQAGKVKHEFADWVEILSSATGYTRENVEEWKGLGTIERYAAELEAVQNRFLRASPDGGFIYEALGLNETDVFDNTARELQSLLQMMTEARLQGEPWSLDDASYRKLLELYERAKEDSAGAGFREIMAEVAEEREKILSASIDPIYEVLDRVKEEMRDSGISAPGTSQALDIIEGNSANYLAALQNRIAEADMSAFDIAVKRLMVEEQITEEAAEQGVKTLELLDAVSFLEDELGRLAGGSYVDFTRELGEAFRDGAVSSDEFSVAIKNMLKSLIDAMPQLLLNTGLRILPGNWAAGLALIGASGLMSFVSGLTDSAEQEGRDEEAERLRRIQEQITDLIDAQRKQQEYYLTQKRKVDSTALSVNDAIITPKGTVYTHPEDYIIATKTPETLMGSGGANVVVEIINNAGAQISQQESIGADGSREILVEIDKYVQSGIASGRYNGAFNAMNAKNQGRKVTT